MCATASLLKIKGFCGHGAQHAAPLQGTRTYAASLKYFRGENIPRRNNSFPQMRRISSDHVTQVCSLRPRKCRERS
jgi:hypothetical protein